jgi:hypothetical protein
MSKQINGAQVDPQRTIGSFEPKPKVQRIRLLPSPTKAKFACKTGQVIRRPDNSAWRSGPRIYSAEVDAPQCWFASILMVDKVANDFQLIGHRTEE